MRRTLMAAVVCATVLASTVIAMAVVGPPEIDRANATMSLTAGSLAQAVCPGEQAPGTYTSVKGKWVGTETDATPGFVTDYSLSGKLIYDATITYNNTTRRGVMKGQATLKKVTPSGVGDKVFQGSLTLIVQEVDRPEGLVWVYRGFLNAPMFSRNAGGILVADGSRILSNVEGSFLPTSQTGGPFKGLVGLFGDESPPLPPQPTMEDYSVVSNELTCI